MRTFPRSTIMKILADLGVEDPESVFRVVLDVGHVTVHGYVRDQLDGFVSKGGAPEQWSSVYPVDPVA
jgi:hypothetical protein